MKSAAVTDKYSLILFIYGLGSLVLSNHSTDETADNCQMFLDGKGMELFIRCREVSLSVSLDLHVQRKTSNTILVFHYLLLVFLSAKCHNTCQLVFESLLVIKMVMGKIKGGKFEFSNWTFEFLLLTKTKRRLDV